MSNPPLRLHGTPTLLQKIATLKKTAAATAARQAAQHLVSKLQTYPPPPNLKRASVYPATFTTPKQQRYFFWALKHGALNLPYRRTGHFAQGWVIASQNGGQTQIITNPAPYGPLLMDPERQSPYMKRTGWPTLDAVLSNEGEDLMKGVRQAVKRTVEG